MSSHDVPAAPSRRARQAAATRLDILAAARRLFVERGYAGANVRDIASAAGVSVQTVYDSVGSKRALVTALNDLADEESGVHDVARALREETDPRALVGLIPRILGAFLERHGDFLRILVDAATHGPDLADALAESRRRHQAGILAIARRLDALGALRPDLDPAGAARVLAGISDPVCVLVYVDTYGWSPAEVRGWLDETLARSVLAPEVGS